jgi:hypothetical protein
VSACDEQITGGMHFSLGDATAPRTRLRSIRSGADCDQLVSTRCKRTLTIRTHFKNREKSQFEVTEPINEGT